MTQVKEWSNAELNRALAELMGWTDFKHDAYGGVWAVAPDDRWTNSLPDYCTDAAASIEVQTAAIAADKLAYLNNLLNLVSPGESIEFGLGGAMEIVGYTIDGTAAILNATPRERTEAAYMTLKEVQG